MLPSLRSVVLCLLLPMALQAQVSMTLTIRNPMPPELSTLESDRTVAQVLLLNAGPALNNARFGITIHEAASGGLLASKRDNSPAMPRVKLPTAGTAEPSKRRGAFRARCANLQGFLVYGVSGDGKSGH